MILIRDPESGVRNPHPGSRIPDDGQRTTPADNTDNTDDLDW
jgi:hypothetical protein